MNRTKFNWHASNADKTTLPVHSAEKLFIARYFYYQSNSIQEGLGRELFFHFSNNQQYNRFINDYLDYTVWKKTIDLWEANESTTLTSMAECVLFY